MLPSAFPTQKRAVPRGQSCTLGAGSCRGECFKLVKFVGATEGDEAAGNQFCKKISKKAEERRVTCRSLKAQTPFLPLTFSSYITVPQITKSRPVYFTVIYPVSSCFYPILPRAHKRSTFSGAGIPDAA